MTEKTGSCKNSKCLTTLRGLDFTTLKTIQLMVRCGIDSFFHAEQLTIPHVSQKGPILILVTDSATHGIEWD